ncbi:MAG TPA: nodulation protein NfeD [candidate division WOR-3 bacterium]|uniref:Nodulation protein NfeD n=1 Tax=candidate division WOR-3 bacterium TaxID=2052148 RepID=A0A9C9EN02_UNCW3|nr:nodulation protein NfeD [candidate division WOR-3 bacterium]
MLAFVLCILLNTNTIYVGELDGVISPASSAYLLRLINIAEAQHATCLIIKLDTPGGLDISMRKITKRLLNTEVPVVVYVAPKGARAASAGVFILYAAHIAAMAPGTNVGAAHPVSMGGEKVDSVMREKVTNDAVAYLKAIAKERGRNEEWAEKAVRESSSIDAETALQKGVCEIIAEDIEDLRAKLNKRVVETKQGEVTLVTESADVKKVSMTLKEQLLLLLTNPNIAYVLLLLGIYGLFFELQNPGMIFPGVVGGICIILGFYALHLLPVNYAGVALIVLSAILFILEIYVTSHGLLTIGGIVSLLLGSLILFESDVSYLRLSWEVIVIAILIIAAFFIFLISLGIHAQFKKKASGKEGFVGKTGTAKTDITAAGGTVFVHGEYWNAVSDRTIKKGDKVKVIEVDGMTLKVEKI